MSADDVAKAALRFYEARNARAAEHKRFQKWCEDNLGDSVCDSASDGVCYQVDPRHTEEWCQTCEARQPHWNAYRDAAKASSRAMSALRAACARELKARQS